MYRKLLAAAMLASAGIGAGALPVAASAHEYAPQAVQYRSEYTQFAPAPPPARVELVPAPRRGHVWVPGHWQWRGHRHVWIGGHWIVARPGYAYVQPRWIERDGRWYFERGRWGRGDADHDGIPNRYDRRPYDPRRG